MNFDQYAETVSKINDKLNSLFSMDRIIYSVQTIFDMDIILINANWIGSNEDFGLVQMKLQDFYNIQEDYECFKMKHAVVEAPEKFNGRPGNLFINYFVGGVYHPFNEMLGYDGLLIEVVHKDGKKFSLEMSDPTYQKIKIDIENNTLVISEDLLKEMYPDEILSSNTIKLEPRFKFKRSKTKSDEIFIASGLMHTFIDKDGNIVNQMRELKDFLI